MERKDLGSIEIGFGNAKAYDVVDFKEFEKSLRTVGFWGFVDKKDLHFWVDKKTARLRDLISLFSHELAHINNRRLKRMANEEERAYFIQQMACVACDMSEDLL